MYFLVCDSFTFTLNLTGTLNRSKPLFLSQIPIWCHHVRLLPWLGWSLFHLKHVLLAKANGDCENNRWYHWYVTNSKAYKTQSLFIKIPFILCQHHFATARVTQSKMNFNEQTRSLLCFWVCYIPPFFHNLRLLWPIAHVWGEIGSTPAKGSSRTWW
jgi:hypothetical protein